MSCSQELTFYWVRQKIATKKFNKLFQLVINIMKKIKRIMWQCQTGVNCQMKRIFKGFICESQSYKDLGVWVVLCSTQTDSSGLEAGTEKSMFKEKKRPLCWICREWAERLKEMSSDIWRVLQFIVKKKLDSVLNLIRSHWGILLSLYIVSTP